MTPYIVLIVNITHHMYDVSVIKKGGDMSNKFINKIFKLDAFGAWRTSKFRKLLKRLAYALSIATLALTPASSVFATSIYDDIVHPTTSLVITEPDGTGGGEITFDLMDFIQDECTTTIYDAFASAITDSDGSWAISQTDISDVKSVAIVWTTSPGASLIFIPGALLAPFEGALVLSLDSNGDRLCTGSLYSSYAYIASPCSPSPCTPIYAPFLSTYGITYPTGYAGENVQVGLGDSDSDGLSLAQEMTQGTTDGAEDTDNDGLTDMTESLWNPDYNEIFCDQFSPYACAHPHPYRKDLFVEIDWINDGTEVYKPSAPQLELVRQKYADIGINFHADDGRNGGGNEITILDYEVTVDIPGDVTPLNVDDNFYAIKWGHETLDSANFSENRYKIWHYMLSGFNWDDGVLGSNASSGKAEGGGDDTFISFGYIEDNPDCLTGFCYSDFDDAIAGIIMHELGHNLCLTNSTGTYSGQASECVHSEIDKKLADNPSVNYHSPMNYRYVFTNNYPYSDGTNGTGDHDDIAGVLLGLNDFTWKDDDSSVGGPS